MFVFVKIIELCFEFLNVKKFKSLNKSDTFKEVQ